MAQATNLGEDVRLGAAACRPRTCLSGCAWFSQRTGIMLVTTALEAKWHCKCRSNATAVKSEARTWSSSLH